MNRYVPTSGTFAQAGKNQISTLRDIKYLSDGSGRDYYAVVDNGGLYSPPKPKDFIVSGRLANPRIIKRDLSNEARPVHYNSDGSGRDSYICKTDGGLTNPSRPCDPRETFKR